MNIKIIENVQDKNTVYDADIALNENNFETIITNLVKDVKTERITLKCHPDLHDIYIDDNKIGISDWDYHKQITRLKEKLFS